MEGRVCATQLAESDANTLSSTPFAASLTDGDKLINTKIKSAQTKGHPSDQDLLKGLLSDDYCHVCDTTLLFEPHRHYEGEMHIQKVKTYLESKRAVGTMSKDSGDLKKDVPTHVDLFCKLCNMMFRSPVVAMSHFKGKVHAKNLRNQHNQPSKELNQPGIPTHSGQTQAPYSVKPAVCTTANPGQDLKDPNYCALCAAPFNNPKMALQHYNGRKHQRNKAREKVMQGLGEDAQQARGLICQVCNARFTSVEMYQAHMKGNKHQVKEKKVIDLCKSQPKDYSSFADELADYIQVQKARGINTPAASHLTPQGGKQKDSDSTERDPRDSVHHRIYELNCPPIAEPPSSKPLSGPGYPAAGWGPPPYQPGPSFPHPALSFPHPALSFPHPVLFPSTGAPYPPNPNRPGPRKRHSEQSSSSSYSSSSSSSSSDSEEEKRKGRRHRSGREERLRERDPDEEVWRTQRRKRVRRDRSQERRGGGEEDGISHTESIRKGRRDPIRRRRPERSREESVEGKGAEETAVAGKDLKARNPSEMQKELVVTRPEAQITPEQAETQMAMPLKPKPRKEKKKQREVEDKRTEEEKLWDESMGLF